MGANAAHGEPGSAPPVLVQRACNNATSSSNTWQEHQDLETLWDSIMIQVTIFAGHDGRFRFDKWFYLTLFAGCDLIRPTIARQLLIQRQAQHGPPPPNRKPFFLTVFGGVSLKSPTLAEEFIDLREMINTGLFSLQEWDRSLALLDRADGGIASLTLFGGFDECELPSENEEVDALAVQRHLGNIPEGAGQALQYGVGQHGAERTATVRRAILAST